MNRKRKTTIFKKTFLLALIAVKLFALPSFALAQTMSDQGGYNSNSEWEELQSVIKDEKFNPEQEKKNRAAIDTNINSLYPRALPNDTSPQNIAVDFASCVLGLLVVENARLAVTGLALLAKTIQHSLDRMPLASGFWHVGLVSGVTAPVAEASVADTASRIERDGISLMGIKVLPGAESLAFCAKNVLYAYLSATIVRWVNEGFSGAAVWVENFADELSKVYQMSFEKAIGDVNVCVDIKGSVEVGARLDFLKTQPIPPRGGCTITISDQQDVELLLTGRAYNSETFRQVYSNPNNNEMGGFLLTTSVANAYVENNEKQFTTELNWFDGMWPWKDENGRIITPGSFVQEKIITALEMPTQHTLLASRWDQVIFMISNQIFKKEINRAIRPLSN